MKRKVVKHGPATLTVSLPTEWTKKFKISQGDEIELGIRGNSLIVSTQKIKEYGSIERDITELDRTTIIIYLRSLYRRGFREIIFKFKKKSTAHYRTGKTVGIISIIHEEVDRLIGMEILEQKEDSCTIAEVTESSSKNFNMMVRNSFLMLEESAFMLKDAAAKNDIEQMQIIEKTHDEVAKTVSYCIRLINQGKAPEYSTSFQLYHMLINVDLILDIFKYFVRSLLEKKKRINKKYHAVFADLADIMRLYSRINTDFSWKTMEEFQEKRDLLKKKAAGLMESSETDMHYIGYLLSVMEITRMGSETKLGMIDPDEDTFPGGKNY